MTAISRAVLVTGCSSGIGRETALRFARGGWTVYATARRLETIEELTTSGCRLLQLDVTDPASASQAVGTVVREQGAVGVLVNNAGVSELGATETVSIERVQRVFDTNVLGMLRMTQLALPAMRAQGWGRVITIGSMNGRWIMPGFGAYAASKHAVEALSDALRFEVRPFGVDVSLIAPGLVRTHFGETAADRREVDPVDGAYDDFLARVDRATRTWDKGMRGRIACDPSDVAERVLRAAASKRPRARYRVAPSAAILLSLRRMLSERAFEAVLRTQFPSPEPGVRRQTDQPF